MKWQSKKSNYRNIAPKLGNFSSKKRILKKGIADFRPSTDPLSFLVKTYIIFAPISLPNVP